MTKASIAVEEDRVSARFKKTSHATHIALFREAKSVISKKKQRRLRSTVDEGRAVNRRDHPRIGHAVDSHTHRGWRAAASSCCTYQVWHAPVMIGTGMYVRTTLDSTSGVIDEYSYS